jgi:beta-glucanase (GH16 family)
MFPQSSHYGTWPRSGEIDLAEGRGNSYSYAMDGVPAGRDVMTSTLHWGPSPATVAYWRTTNGKALRRTDYTEEYHTFGVEWSEDYIYTYLDSRLVQVLFMSFKTQEDLWQRGNFSTLTENSTFLENPWVNTTDKSAPFDQEFFLILNVAVGSRNGWFK